jgi:hypothetical protein
MHDDMESQPCYNDKEQEASSTNGEGDIEMAWMTPITTANRRDVELAEEGQEEENMTEYTHDDLRQDWEFKIVRSGSGAFRNPEVLNRLVEEEARAGWVLLEKFDDNRVRFKRSRSAQSRDAFLPSDVDPYRTQYGAPVARRAAVVAVVISGLLALGGVMAFLYTERGSTSIGTTPFPVIAPAILIILGLVVALKRASSR